MTAICIKRIPCDPFRLEDKVCSVCQLAHDQEQNAKVNWRAWAANMLDFLRFKGIEHEFTHWCGGWRCPPIPEGGATKDQKDVWRALQYEIEGVILRRMHDHRIEGYTLEMSKELTALYFAFRPDKVQPNECPSCKQPFENGGQCAAPVMRGGCPMGGDV